MIMWVSSPLTTECARACPCIRPHACRAGATGHADAAPFADAVCLRGFLELLPDPRDRRGRRYAPAALLGAAAASVLAGARSLPAISEWLTDALRWAPSALGSACDPLTGHLTLPHPGTVRRLPAGSTATFWTRVPAPFSAPVGPLPKLHLARDCARSPWTARRWRLAHPHPPRDNPVGRHGTHRGSPRPEPGRGQEQRDPPPSLRCSTLSTYPHRDHRRRPAHPARPRRLPA